MSANYSTATQSYAYQPTIIEDKVLISRLAIQIAFVRDEFKRDPRGFAAQLIRDLLANPKIIVPLVLATVVLTVVMKQSNVPLASRTGIVDDPLADVVMLEPIERAGHAGFNEGNGDGSGSTPRRAHGGGGGGDHTPKPQQTGKLPPPSTMLAPIPITPSVNPRALPVAGIKIDPALWKDLEAPVYGDPTSTSTVPSKGPGEGGGIGNGRGLGVGSGDGPGVGPGSKGNTGGRSEQDGCCGTGGGRGAGLSGIMRTTEVDQRVRVLSKPEPQYTEEARRNQIIGTVVLRTVFSSDGEVVQIRALNTLPFGLTERAVAAARQIKFMPAMKGGHPVSVFMQLEYNFNLY
jgi:TonB family protein